MTPSRNPSQAPDASFAVGSGARIKTPIPIASGWLAGCMIRRARKPLLCQCVQRGRFCGKAIAQGTLYAEGEGSGETGRNGVLLQERYCLDCAGEDARAALTPVPSHG